MVLGRRADAGDILGLSPDVVILATGSTPSWPDFLPAGWREEGLIPDLREAIRLLADHPGRHSGTAVLWDEDHGAFTYDAAEFLMQRFERVAILTPRERLASDESLVVRQGVYHRLYRGGATILTSVRPLPDPRIAEGEVAYANIFSGARSVVTDVAFLTFATPRRPDDGLDAPLRAAGIDVRRIGDCKAPRIALTATGEGYRAAMDI
jgi:hypothetical protein